MQIETQLNNNSLAATVITAVMLTCPPLARSQTQVVGVNVSLGDDPSELPEDRRAQAEPHLARSPVDPDLFIATFQEGRFEDGGAVDNGYALSQDGGRTWTRSLVPHLTTAVGNRFGFDRASDPVAAVAWDGSIYLNSLAFATSPLDGSDHTAVYLSQVHINKTTGAIQIRVPLTVIGANDLWVGPDKNWMTVNSFPNTPTSGRIVVTFTTILDIGFDWIQPSLLKYRDPTGGWSDATWFGPPLTQGTVPLFLADGSLAIIYWNFVDWPTSEEFGQIECVYSADGGGTFGLPTVVAPVQMHSDAVARSAHWIPSATTDRLRGVIYVAYQARDGGMNDGAPGVLFTKSIDRGRTWSAPVPVNDTPDGKSVFNPTIAVSPDGQHVTIIFYDKRNGAENPALVDQYLAQSFDGGDTWEPNVKVSEVISDLLLAPLTGRGRMFGDYQGLVPALNFDAPGMALWIDTRTGSPDPFVATIHRTRGTTFKAWRRLRYAEEALGRPEISGEEADEDGDGIPNLMEYVFAFEPDVPNASPVTITLDDSAAEPTLVVRHHRLAVLGDAEVGVVVSTNLNDWDWIVAESESVILSDDPTLEDVKFRLPLTAESARYFRLTARIQPSGPDLATRSID